MKKTRKWHIFLLFVIFALLLCGNDNVMADWDGNAIPNEYSCGSSGGYRTVYVNPNGGNNDWSVSQSCGYYIWYSDKYESTALTNIDNGIYTLSNFTNNFGLGNIWYKQITSNPNATIGCGKSPTNTPQYDDKLGRGTWGGGNAYTSGNTLYYSIESIGSTSLMVLPTPSRTGYEFTGWQIEYTGICSCYSDSLAGKYKDVKKDESELVIRTIQYSDSGSTYYLLNIDEYVPESITVTAQWKATSKYLFSIKGDSGVESVTNNGTYWNYNQVAESWVTFKTGYHLKKIVGTDIAGNYDSSWTAFDGEWEGHGYYWTATMRKNRSFSIYSEPNTYYVTYDANGGTNAPATQAFLYNSGDKISNKIPTRESYRFIGWSWAYGDNVWQAGDVIPNGTGSFTLTAQWIKIYSDENAPEITLNGVKLNSTDRKVFWFKGTVATLSSIFTDDISGLKEIYMQDEHGRTKTTKFPISGTLTYTDSYMVYSSDTDYWGFKTSYSPDGLHFLNLRASDYNGNYINTDSDIGFDNIAPSGNISVNPVSWTNQYPFVQAYGTDSESGMESVELYDAATNELVASGVGNIGYTGAKEGITSYYAIFTDRVGNTYKSETVYAYYDITKPIINVNDSYGWYNKSTSITISSEDTLSGIKEMVLLDKNDNILSRSETHYIKYSFSSEGINTYKVCVEDVAGNVSEKFLTVRIDTEAPKLTNNSDQIWHNKSVKITMNGYDDASGVKQIVVYNLDNTVKNQSNEITLEDTFSSEGKNSYLVKIYDYAGNSSLYTVYAYIDKTSPVITTDAINQITGKIRVNANDEGGSGFKDLYVYDKDMNTITKYEYVDSKKNSLTINSFEEDIDEYKVIAHDNAGNETIISVFTNNAFEVEASLDNLTRLLDDNSILIKGEDAEIHIKTTGYVDYIEVEFDNLFTLWCKNDIEAFYECNKLKAESKEIVVNKSERVYNTDYRFSIPKISEIDKDYYVVVRAYKNGKVKEVKLPFTIIEYSDYVHKVIEKEHGRRVPFLWS